MRYAELLSLLTILSIGGVKTISESASSEWSSQVGKFFEPNRHTNNWAILVCTSRFWFNYRHVANALSVYHSVKRLGIPDSHIILMTADDMACNARNPRPARVYNNKNEAIDLYGSAVEVDYRGYEVTVENFIRVLTGRLPPDTPRSKRLSTDDRSNVLIYMTGHGGEGFLKFQDAEEISDVEVADAFEQMWRKQRYNELLFIVDTCQAVSMYRRVYSPNVLAIGSSQIGEDSLSHHIDPALGVYVIDRFTYHMLDFLEKITPSSEKKIEELFKVCPKRDCISTPGSWTSGLARPLERILITDFFGSVRTVEVNDNVIRIAITSVDATSESNHDTKAAEAFEARNYVEDDFLETANGQRISELKQKRPDESRSKYLYQVVLAIIFLFIAKR